MATHSNVRHSQTMKEPFRERLIWLFHMGSYVWVLVGFVGVTEAQSQKGVVDLSSALAILEDPLGDQAFEAVQHSLDFRASPNGFSNVGYSRSVWWLRFEVPSAHARTHTLLEVSNPTLSLIRLYVPRQGGGYEAIHSGTFKPFDERPVAHTTFLFKIPETFDPVQPLYLRIYSDEPVRFALRLWVADAFWAADQPEQFLYGAYYGILFIIAVYNLILFLMVRDPVYGLFVLLLVVFGLLEAVSAGYALAYLWPEAVQWNQEARGLLNGMLAVVSLFFGRQFLDTRTIMPRLDNGLLGLMVCGGLLVVLKILLLLEVTTSWSEVHSRIAILILIVALGGLYIWRPWAARWFTYRPSIYAGVPLAFLSTLLFMALLGGSHVGNFDRFINGLMTFGVTAGLISASIIGWRRGFRPAFLFLIGVGTLLLGSLIGGTLHVGLVAGGGWIEHVDEGGAVLSMMLLSLSVGDRISVLQKRVQHTEHLLEQERRTAVEARLEALQANIHPHFLFNTLNTIASLIRLDATKAERAIEKLASLFRYTLRQRTERFVSLTEELQIVQTYLALEEHRLEERLRYAIETEGDLDAVRIPALMLQPIVENSIKYAVATRKAGGTIHVRAIVTEQICTLIVADDGPGLHHSEGGHGYALENIRERLRLLYGDSASLTLCEDQGVTVRLQVDREIGEH